MTYHASAVFCRFLLFAVGVVLGFVEVREQEQEHNAVQAYPNHEALRVVTFDKQQLELVNENAHELELKKKKHVDHRSFL